MLADKALLSESREYQAGIWWWVAVSVWSTCFSKQDKSLPEELSLRTQRKALGSIGSSDFDEHVERHFEAKSVDRQKALFLL